jgi:tetratricopeptide (TPR) repeat protein
MSETSKSSLEDKLERLRLHTSKALDDRVKATIAGSSADACESDPIRKGRVILSHRLSAMSPRVKVVGLAATAAGLAVAVGIAALTIFSARPAYALSQTMQALKQVRFMHIFRYSADGSVADERWIEIGDNGHQLRYRQDAHAPLDFFVVQDEKTVLAYYRDKNTVVLTTPEQQEYQWLGDFGAFFKDFQGEGTVVINPNAQFHGRRAYFVRWLKLDAEAYVDPETKLPLYMDGYDIQYEKPPAGAFDIVVPKGALVVDKRPDAPLAEEPAWMKGEKTAEVRFVEARTAQSAGNYEKAERLYEEAVKLEPRLNWAWFWLGCVQSKLTKYDLAVASYTKVIALFREIAGAAPHYAYLARAMAYRAEGKEAEARRDLAVALPVMIDALCHSEGAQMFDYADDPLYGKHPKPTPEESRSKMYDRLRLATGQAPTEAAASDEQRNIFWENWWKEHAAEYGAAAQ